MSIARNYLFITFVSFPLMVNAQLSVWAEAGLNVDYTTSNSTSTENVSKGSYYSPGFSLNCRTNYNGTLNIGLSIYFEHYNINYSYSQDSISNTNQGYERDNDNYTSNFIFLAPVFDFRIDRRNIWHFELLPSFGFFVFLKDDVVYHTINTTYAVSNSSAPLNKEYYREYDGADYINKSPFNFGLKVYRSFHLTNKGQLLISAAYNVMANRPSTIIDRAISLHPQVFSVGVGYVMNTTKKTKTESGIK